MSKEWEITEVITVIRKAEVKADSYDEAKEIYDDLDAREKYEKEYHKLDWYTDEEFVDDCDMMTGHIEEIE